MEQKKANKELSGNVLAAATQVKRAILQEKHSLENIKSSLDELIKNSQNEDSFMANLNTPFGQPQQTLLFTAARFAKDDVVEYLLNLGADPHVQCEYEVEDKICKHYKPFHVAIIRDHMATAELFYRHKSFGLVAEYFLPEENELISKIQNFVFQISNENNSLINLTTTAENIFHTSDQAKNTKPLKKRGAAREPSYDVSTEANSSDSETSSDEDEPLANFHRKTHDSSIGKGKHGLTSPRKNQAVKQSPAKKSKTETNISTSVKAAKSPAKSREEPRKPTKQGSAKKSKTEKTNKSAKTVKSPAKSRDELLESAAARYAPLLKEYAELVEKLDLINICKEWYESSKLPIDPSNPRPGAKLYNNNTEPDTVKNGYLTRLMVLRAPEDTSDKMAFGRSVYNFIALLTKNNNSMINVLLVGDKKRGKDKDVVEYTLKNEETARARTIDSKIHYEGDVILRRVTTDSFSQRVVKAWELLQKENISIVTASVPTMATENVSTPSTPPAAVEITPAVSPTSSALITSILASNSAAEDPFQILQDELKQLNAEIATTEEQYQVALSKQAELTATKDQVVEEHNTLKQKLRNFIEQDKERLGNLRQQTASPKKSPAFFQQGGSPQKSDVSAQSLKPGISPQTTPTIQQFDSKTGNPRT